MQYQIISCFLHFFFHIMINSILSAQLTLFEKCYFKIKYFNFFFKCWKVVITFIKCGISDYFLLFYIDLLCFVSLNIELDQISKLLNPRTIYRVQHTDVSINTRICGILINTGSNLVYTLSLNFV